MKNKPLLTYIQEGKALEKCFEYIRKMPTPRTLKLEVLYIGSNGVVSLGPSEPSNNK